MKKRIFLFTFLIAAFISSHAQQLSEISAAPGKFKNLNENIVDPLRETVFWQEDFSEGIPGDWLNADAGGIAYWEYRGTATDPNNETGTRGSCLPEGSVGAPIQSESWTNGFVIFDSNWWDDPIGPCGNLGSGPAPAPHDTWLQLPAFDFSSHPQPGLIFSQYAKYYNTTMAVEVSVNNGPWFEVFFNDLIVNQSTPLNDVQRINLTPTAGGQSSVHIRFHFTGTYYFWMLDDLKLVDLDDNNMFNESSTYGDYDFYDEGNPTGYEWLEYSQYPDELSPLLKFTTMGSNFGAFPQTDVSLHIEIKNENNNTEIHDAVSSETFTVQPGNTAELRVGNYQMPSTIAEYSVRFEITQNEEEQAPADNNDTLYFRITDVTYARDKGPAEGVFIPIEEYNDHAYEVGNIFLVTENGINAHSISMGVSVGSVTPATVYGRIYEFEIDTTVHVTLLGTTPAVEFTSNELNNYGDEFLVTIQFPSSIPLTNGHAYLVVAGTEDGPDNVVFSMSGDSPEFSSWTWFDTDEWFYLPEMPMVRLNTGPFVSVEENESAVEHALKCWLSPANEILNVSFDLMNAGIIGYDVFDLSGKNVLTGNIIGRTGNNSLQLNTSQFSNGMYTLHLKNDLSNLTGTFSVIR